MRIRKLEIENFRGIRKFEWLPAPGANCLIGPCDSGKSTILDAIDLCLGARRQVQFTDADFHRLNVDVPIRIAITVGELSDPLKKLDTYGHFLRGFNAESHAVSDEPEAGSETALTVTLTVAGDLEPVWSLFSERAQEQGTERHLSWGDRAALSPTRVGAFGDYHLGWRRGSVLNRLSEERPDLSAVLAKAARDARLGFGEEANVTLQATLTIVADTARELGIPIGDAAKALLDAHSVSFSGGTISVHDAQGVPLGAMGVGSTRLLTVGLQRKVATESSIVLIDELEYGLEPHRIIRLLGSLGAKDSATVLQVFMTTHSPVAVRELAGNQLFVVRGTTANHECREVGIENEIQGTIRSCPEAFLSRSPIVCEGASEVGLLRGLDLYRTQNGDTSISALGVALVDGGGIHSTYVRGRAIAGLGYRTAILRDDDERPAAEAESAFLSNRGTVFTWRAGRKLEDELFQSLPDGAIGAMIDRAVEIYDELLINDHIKSATSGTIDLASCRTSLTGAARVALGKAAGNKTNPWFKNVTHMEKLARDIVGPALTDADAEFAGVLRGLFTWANDGS